MNNIRVYNDYDCIVFMKTNEKYGGLSNMSSKFPININNINILTSEALYQSMKFPDYPNIQKKIISQKSPINAKRISIEYGKFIREDWYTYRLRIMEWVLYVKLLNNWHNFGYLLELTKGYKIVEKSYKDSFWGAYPKGNNYIGVNALGRLLMSIREAYIDNKNKKKIELKSFNNIVDLKLLGEDIGSILLDISSLDIKKKETYENIKLW